MGDFSALFITALDSWYFQLVLKSIMSGDSAKYRGSKIFSDSITQTTFRGILKDCHIAFVTYTLLLSDAYRITVKDHQFFIVN